MSPELNLSHRSAVELTGSSILTSKNICARSMPRHRIKKPLSGNLERVDRDDEQPVTLTIGPLSNLEETRQ